MRAWAFTRVGYPGHEKVSKIQETKTYAVIQLAEDEGVDRFYSTLQLAIKERSPGIQPDMFAFGIGKEKKLMFQCSAYKNVCTNRNIFFILRHIIKFVGFL